MTNLNNTTHATIGVAWVSIMRLIPLLASLVAGHFALDKAYYHAAVV